LIIARGLDRDEYGLHHPDKVRQLILWARLLKVGSNADNFRGRKRNALLTLTKKAGGKTIPPSSDIHYFIIPMQARKQMHWFNEMQRKSMSGGIP